ncbi:unnamed protein product, partial [Medioppia subpectinata]
MSWCPPNGTCRTSIGSTLTILWLTLWVTVWQLSVVCEHVSDTGSDATPAANDGHSSAPAVDDHLVINVMNGGQEVYQEVIAANTTDDVITVDFLETDASLITQFIDFKAEVQIFRIYRLGEQDLNESQYKVYCFVTHLLRNEFISSDAMSKLRQ